MPAPPDEGLLTRFVLENPWPLGAALLLLGIAIGWWGLRDGRVERLQWALVPVVLGIAVGAAGIAYVTAGEHARHVARDLVDDVVAGDLVGAMDHFAQDVRVHLGKTENVPHDYDFLTAALSTLPRRWLIEDNRITMLRGYTTGHDTATVHLACWTEAGYGYTPSQWVLEVERRDGDAWLVSRLTLISVSGQPPPSSW